MMVITKKQLKKFNDKFCEANLSADGEKVLIEVMQILGLRHTRVDGVKCIVPESANEMYWSHAMEGEGMRMFDIYIRGGNADIVVEGVREEDLVKEVANWVVDGICVEVREHKDERRVR